MKAGRRRGSLTLWIEDGALEHWQSCGPSGQARYADAAIQTSLVVRAAFKLAFVRGLRIGSRCRTAHEVA
jgi:hypothetical protein